MLRRASIFNYLSGPLLKLVCALYMTDAKLICKMNPPIKLTDPPLGKVIGHLSKEFSSLARLAGTGISASWLLSKLPIFWLIEQAQRTVLTSSNAQFMCSHARHKLAILSV